MTGATPGDKCAALWRRCCKWVLTALIGIVLPLLFRSGTALTLMSLICISIVFALSYNILLGQTGLLSFGHAVYFGFGAYVTIHCMNAVITRGLPLPLPVIPLSGGIGGLVFAIMFGWICTKRSRTAFAMITLGIGELVSSSALILRSFFGGEEGVGTDRSRMLWLFGVSFSQQMEVYYLIAGWCLLCTLLMYKFTRTPVGQLCNAVRDNAERVQFVGYNPQVVRFIAFCASGFFAGIAGGLAIIHFEIANSAYFSAAQSANVLLATFIGGSSYFMGPVIGAALVTSLQVMLSDVTDVWQLYFGLLFILMVMFAPQGIAGLFMMHWHLLRRGPRRRIAAAYMMAFPPALAMLLGFSLLIEMAYRLGVKSAEGPAMTFLKIPLFADDPIAWLTGSALAIVGFAFFRLTWFGIAAAWAGAGSVEQP
jgi:branched-chain amino acid transport system permease protein